MLRKETSENCAKKLIYEAVRGNFSREVTLMPRQKREKQKTKYVS